ncbi:hypothetical protein PIB30_064544 [Stylosanthes scabra]|uniref:Uncharacterized protein n=1 Tax=Stylosanthes scabra TaxID=79078 RepID=A0ABU6WK40_9FABA|nr:hypothetical protein [Stylosanthes scabra]
MFSEFCSAIERSSYSSLLTPPHGSWSASFWIALPPNNFKINFDAAGTEESGWGVRAVIRSNDGIIMAAVPIANGTEPMEAVITFDVLGRSSVTSPLDPPESSSHVQ